MKKVLQQICVAMLALTVVVSVSAQTRKERKALFNSADNYEIAVIGVGQDGTKVFKVWGFAKDADAAIVQAKKNAVAACIFRGITGGNGADATPPICPETDALDKHADFFDKFFETGNQYLRYVNLTTDGAPSGADRLKIKGGYKVAISIQILYDALRKDLEAAGVARKLNEGFEASGGTPAATKPSIMVVPSDVYCNANGYVQKFTDNGVENVIPDYKKLMQNDRQMRLAITKMGAIMAQRGFPLKDLEQELKNLAQEEAETAALMSKGGSDVAESPIDKLKRTAKADIIMDLDFNIKKAGPRNTAIFNLKGLDAYTGMQVTGVGGTGAPSISAEPELLLEEAVLSYMDNFNGQLMTHFEDMFKNGRQIKLQLKRFSGAPWDFDEEFEVNGETKEFGDIVDEWLSENAKNGTYKRVDGSENTLKYEVRIPLFKTSSKGKQSAIDARDFAGELRSKVLRKAPVNVDSKLYQRGLGEAWIIVGEK